MDKVQLIEKLGELGIVTDNVHPKSSFPFGGKICIGLYEREMKDDFYFFNNYDKKIYKWVDQEINYPIDKNTEKRMIPLDECQIIWEDKPYIELPDLSFREMTVRQYACIKLGVPESGLPWLDILIKKSPIQEALEMNKEMMEMSKV